MCTVRHTVHRIMYTLITTRHKMIYDNKVIFFNIFLPLIKTTLTNSVPKYEEKQIINIGLPKFE